ncbi:MAG TPA: hypothetical protein VGI16_09860 [Candidatus Acidoferrum sp.]|jgi:hypothetical protein
MDTERANAKLFRDVRLELISFSMLFLAFAASDSLFELHKIGHPVVNILLRSLLTAALAALALWVFHSRRAS